MVPRIGTILCMSLVKIDKTERLLNLTMALLNTKSVLSKEEIFISVAGYSGTPEAMERMFERDKDDLRELNIEILVEAKDKYFDDEVGYRIAKANFEMPEVDFSTAEIYWLSLAATIWRGAALEDLAQQALFKVQSTSSEYLTSEHSNAIPTIQTAEPIFFAIWSAINQRKIIKFCYRGKDGKRSDRTVAPYSLVSRRGHWYLIAAETNSQEIKIFKLNRFQNQPTAKSSENGFAIPGDYIFTDHVTDISESFEDGVEVLCKPGAGDAIRKMGTLKPSIHDGWDLICLDNVDFNQLLYNILWCGPDAKVLKPENLKNAVIEGLKKVIETHNR